MPSPNRTLWLFIATLFACGIVTITFYPVLASHFHAVPHIGSDAGKNIFTLVYHSLYGKGLHFTGMNYPYGEHVMYTDGQPLLSVPLSYLGCNNAGTALSAMWLLLLLSYVLAIVFTFRTISHFGVHPLFSMVFSGLIVLMSAQLLRTTYHFGLSYACVAPMLFFWTIRYHDTSDRKYAIYVFVMGLVVNFLHPYLSAVVLVWVGLYCAGYYLSAKPNITERLKHILPLLCSVLLMFAVIGLWIHSTDKVKDRPVTPYGLTVYCTQGIDIFTSYSSPVWRHMDDDKGSIRKSSANEGATYPGIVVIFILVCMLVRSSLRWKARKRTLPADADKYTFPFIYLFMAMAALLLAMGVPFVWNMEWLVNYMSFARQFRTLGRFAWIFYYIMTVYGAVTLYRWYINSLQSNRKAMAYGVMAISVALWACEASGYICSLHDKMKNSNKNYDLLTNKANDSWPQFLAKHHYEPAAFQAILMLPYFHVGTDKLWVGDEASEGDMGEGSVAGIQLHLPWVNAMMARSSWSIAERQVKITGGRYTEKPMLNDLGSDKPFLLIHASGSVLNGDQAYLLRSSDHIATFRSYDVDACYPRRIQQNDHNARDSARMIAAAMAAGSSDTCVGCEAVTWYVNHFDTGKAGQWFWGGGGEPQFLQPETEVVTIPIRAIITSQVFEFSCWFLLGDQNYRSPFFKLDLLDAKGNILGTYDVLTKKSTDNEGLWFRSSSFFTVSADCAAIRCRLRNEPEDTYVAMDELQLRPAGAIVISRSRNDGRIMVNNHLLKQ